MADFDRESEALFVQKLYDGDNGAWEAVYTGAVLPVLRTTTRGGISYYRIVQDRALDERSIHSMLFEDMIHKERLKNYRYGCPVVYWMRHYVTKLILEFCKKNDSPVSDEDYKNVFISESRQEEWDLVEQCFAELWKDKPMQAYVLLLRDKVGLSSKKVAALLNHTNDANINQIHRRAFQELLSIAKNIREQE